MRLIKVIENGIKSVLHAQPGRQAMVRKFWRGTCWRRLPTSHVIQVPWLFTKACMFTCWY